MNEFSSSGGAPVALAAAGRRGAGAPDAADAEKRTEGMHYQVSVSASRIHPKPMPKPQLDWMMAPKRDGS